ncbi:MAG TPA: hypothetical protein VGX48_26135 [Pyrinomonadaceae bacterium]|jgi:hypothetical protein|nr:hypothetical protein [Pyrinomonadaceae bacterium]
MNNRSFLVMSLTAVVFAPALRASAQEPAHVHTRPRTVAAAQQTPTPVAVSPSPSPTPRPVAPPIGTQPTTTAPQFPTSVPAPQPTPSAAELAFVGASPLQPAKPMPVARFRQRTSDAQRQLKSRLQLTSMTPSTGTVTVAALDPDSSQIHLLTLFKDTFLKRGNEVYMTTSLGTHVRLQVVRSNYVNTAVVISDPKGRQLTPLVVEYPIEKGGRFREMAYYTSAHPALMSPDVVKHGKDYVRNMLDLAAGRLKDKGKVIAPEIVDIAERLCVVEHVDHDRFRREDRGRLYEEIYSLFGLNELDTYRYSVSSAGAGGMVQMIAPTYQMVRRMHPAVGLNPDFVAGMRNHGNALEAMLLYMQDTWNDMALNEEVLEALRTNTASRSELMAAGYNSNPARLPLYLRRGGTGWRSLIPRETQMYLQIYSSVESLVQFKNRGSDPKPAAPRLAPAPSQSN